MRVQDGYNTIDLISIDHLPSLFPRESSQAFSKNLTPLLINLLSPNPEKPIWARALKAFTHTVEKTSPTPVHMR